MQIKNQEKLLTSAAFVVPAALLCCALWGSATPFIKTGYELLLPQKDVPSTILFAGIRFAIAGLLTVLFYSLARGRLLYPKRESLHRVGIVAVFQTVVQYIFFYIGLANTTGVKGTVASGSSLFFSILISSLIFRQEKLTVKKCIACLLGFGGIIVVNLNGLSFDMNFLGDGFVIFSAISLAISSVLMKRFSTKEDPVVLSGYQFVLGGTFMVVLGLLLGGKIRVENIRGVLVLLYLSLLSAVAYALWGILLKHNPISKVTIFNCTTPIFGVLLSMLMLSEDGGVKPINLMFALLLICAGIFIINYQRPTKKDNS